MIFPYYTTKLFGVWQECPRCPDVSFVVKKANHKEHNGFTKYTKSEKDGDFSCGRKHYIRSTG